MEQRRGGITFQVDKTFKYHGMEIPQAELYRLACEMNLADLVKRSLAAEWFRRKHEAAKRQQTATQRNDAQQA